MQFPKPEKRKKVSKQAEWYKVMHGELIPQFQEWGITSCEIGFDSCTKMTYLGFAHTKKRRFISSDEDLRRVVLACQPCHSTVEYFCKEKTGQDMTIFLEGIISKRVLTNSLK